MNQKNAVWTVAKLVAVAAAAALAMNYEKNNTDEATQQGRLTKTLPMWTIGFAVASVGGIAVLATLPGLLAVLGATSVVIITLGAVLGAGEDAKQRAEARFADIDAAYHAARRPDPAVYTVPDDDFDGDEVYADGGPDNDDE